MYTNIYIRIALGLYFIIVMASCSQSAPQQCDSDKCKPVQKDVCPNAINGIGSTSINTQGRPCYYNCQCSNQNYEGYCVILDGSVLGTCTSQKRLSCPYEENRKVVKQCTLPESKRVKDCATGFQLCRDKGLREEKWGDCQPYDQKFPESGPELCSNGLDDDCDGFTDYSDTSCVCRPGAKEPCYTGPTSTSNVGQCRDGIRTCTDQGKWGSCEGEALPTKEVCNGLDDDCNGKTDEKLTCDLCGVAGDRKSCFTVPSEKRAQGICKDGFKLCRADPENKSILQWGPCENEVKPKPTEICGNGLDDDCDGKPDQGCKCTPPGKVEPCYSPTETKEPTLPCKTGTRVCSSNGTWSECLNQVLPQQEDCNLKDDDCDGVVDNAKGSTKVSSLERSCYTAKSGCTTQPDGTLKCTDPCKQGKQSCLNGNWTACQNETQPTKEICDGIDNNCDGKVDNDIPTNEYPLCPNQLGGCKGSRTPPCKNGAWPACNYLSQFKSYSSQETCDGLDNNCNGQVDEGILNCVSTQAGDGQEGSKDGQGTTAQFSSPRGISVDLGGNVYIAGTSSQKVRRLDTCGYVQTLAGTGTTGIKNGQAALSQFVKISDVAIGPLRLYSGTSSVVYQDNILFIVDQGAHQIRALDNQGNVSLFAGANGQGNLNGPITKASFSFPEAIAIDRKLTTLYISEDRSNRIRKISPISNGVCCTAHNQCQTSYTGYCVSLFAGYEKSPGLFPAGFRDGPAKKARFWSPSGMAVDSKGNLFIADVSNRIIRKISWVPGNQCGLKSSARVNCVTTIAGKKPDTNNQDQVIRSYGGYKDGPADQALFVAPHSITIDSNDNLYVTDQNDPRVRKISWVKNQTCSGSFIKEGYCVTTVAGVSGYGYKDGPPSSAKFGWGLVHTLSPWGEIWFADMGNHRIRNLRQTPPPSKHCVTTWSGPVTPPRFTDPPTQLSTFADGQRQQSRFAGPRSLTTTNQGDIFVADTGNHRIRHIDTLGKTKTLAGSFAGWRDGPAHIARFKNPADLVQTSSGTLWVTDAQNFRIRQIKKVTQSACGSHSSHTGDCVTTIAGDGNKGSVDGPALKAQFDALREIDTGIQNPSTIYVVEYGRNKIRKLEQQTKGTTCAGTPLAQDGYCVTTLSGSQAGKTGFQDGPTSSALFNEPWGLAVAGNPQNKKDTLYITDRSNQLVRQIAWVEKGQCNTTSNYTGYCVTTIAGTLPRQNNGGAWNTFRGYQDGPAAQALFSYPAGLTRGKDGSLYIADSVNRMVRKVYWVNQGTCNCYPKTSRCQSKTNYTGYCVSTYAGAINVENRCASTITKETPPFCMLINGKLTDLRIRNGYLDGWSIFSMFGPIQGVSIDSKNRLFIADGPRIRAVLPK